MAKKIVMIIRLILAGGINVFAQSANTTNLPNSFVSKIRENLDALEDRPEISIEQMKSDLVGRQLVEQEGGYHYEGWTWEIEYDDIKAIEVLQDRWSSKEYECETYLVLQKEGSAHEAVVRMNYVKNQNDLWKLEFIKCNKIQIIRTGKYDDCITAARVGRDYEYQLQLVNHSDIPLVVGGKLYSQSTKQWVNFSQIVDACSTKLIGGLFSISVLDYKIEFIEKP